MLLTDRTVLLVDPDGVNLERLASELKGHGARCFAARDAVTAAWGARETLPDVVVSEVGLPDMDARELIGELRSALESTELAAVGLSVNHALAGSTPPRTEADGVFEKFLVKPVAIADLVDAICCVLGERSLPQPGGSPATELIDAALTRHDYRHFLAALNASSGHRYSAFFRCDGAELRSVWTFDRERPRHDPFKLRIPVAETPFATLIAAQRSLAIDDVNHDRRSSTEPRHSAMRAFVGVPLVGLDAITFGVLCHFDPDPRSSSPETITLLEHAGAMIRSERRRRPR
jgi:CheY-like chemotaxis protein